MCTYVHTRVLCTMCVQVPTMGIGFPGTDSSEPPNVGARS